MGTYSKIRYECGNCHRMFLTKKQLISTKYLSPCGLGHLKEEGYEYCCRLCEETDGVVYTSNFSQTEKQKKVFEEKEKEIENKRIRLRKYINASKKKENELLIKYHNGEAYDVEFMKFEIKFLDTIERKHETISKAREKLSKEYKEITEKLRQNYNSLVYWEDRLKEHKSRWENFKPYEIEKRRIKNRK